MDDLKRKTREQVDSSADCTHIWPGHRDGVWIEEMWSFDNGKWEDLDTDRWLDNGGGK